MKQEHAKQEKKKGYFRSLDERNGIDGLGGGQSKDVACGIAQRLGLDDAAHDLAGPGSWAHRSRSIDRLWISHGTQDSAHVLGQLLVETRSGFNSGLENDEGHDYLILDLIGLADDCSLGDLGMRYQGAIPVFLLVPNRVFDEILAGPGTHLALGL